MEYDLLESLVNEKLSIQYIAQRLSCSKGRIRYWLEKHQLKTDPYLVRPNCLCCNTPLSNKRSTYCSNRCQTEYQYNRYIEKWLLGEVSGHINNAQKQLSSHVKRWLFDRANSKCEKCGWAEVNEVSGNIPLQVDHIDGNCLNTVPSNLRLLCPNCHSLTPTWGNLNQSVGRRRLGIH